MSEDDRVAFGAFVVAIVVLCLAGRGCLRGFDRSLRERCFHQCTDVSNANVSTYDDTTRTCVCTNGNVYTIHSVTVKISENPHGP